MTNKLAPLKIHEDKTIQVRVGPICNGFIVRAGPGTSTYFEDIEEAAEAVRLAIIEAHTRSAHK